MHKKRLEKRLTNTQQLISYAHALDILRGKGIDTKDYLMKNYVSIQSLSYKYKKKEVYDRAFFGFFISNNAPCDGSDYNSLMEVLLSYLGDSTIYCRENVLKALYAMGNSQAIENAFQIMNDSKCFHHHKLLSDGLITFTGDREQLAETMWSHVNEWDENIVISLIKFISVVSDKFNERLFFMLNSQNIGIEVHIAIIRYYRNHIYQPMKPILLGYLMNESNIDENIKIVATSILDKYPGEDTIVALKYALKSPSWYVRYNAAHSLMNLKVDINKLQDIMEGDDRYAKEMIMYVMDSLERTEIKYE